MFYILLILVLILVFSFWINPKQREKRKFDKRIKKRVDKLINDSISVKILDSNGKEIKPNKNPIKNSSIDFSKSLKQLKKESSEWNRKFNNNVKIFKTAKELEKKDPYKAIELYESIKNTNYGNFATLERLIILYRKTRQPEKELQAIDFNIEDLQNKEYHRMIFCIEKYPDQKDYIRICYESGTDCIMPNGSVINFKKNILKLQERKNKILS